MTTVPNITTLSPREVTFANTRPLTFVCDGMQYTLAPGQPVYMADAGRYDLRVVESADYATAYARVNVPDSVPDDGSDPTRLVIDKQALLNAAKAMANLAVDSAAGVVRERYITCVPGQALVYEQKRREALAYQADTSIDHAQVPHLASEAAMNGVTLDAQAATYLAMAEQWSSLSAQIEVKRLGAKAAVDACTTVDAITALPQVDWSMSQG